MPKKDVKEFLIFIALTVFIVAHFLLQDYPNTQFYLALMILSLFCLLAFRYYHMDREFPFRFDDNLNLEKWAWIIGGAIAIYGVSAFFASVTAPTGEFEPSIYVPQFGYSVTYLSGSPLQFQLPTFFNDMLFNVVLVAPAEELCKLVSTLALFLYLARYITDKKWRTGISVAVPTGFWAVLHVYRNPAYLGNYWFVVSAFASGLILYVVLWKTGSVLASILAHAGYNCLIIFLSSLGYLVIPKP